MYGYSNTFLSNSTVGEYCIFTPPVYILTTETYNIKTLVLPFVYMDVKFDLSLKVKQVYFNSSLRSMSERITTANFKMQKMQQCKNSQLIVLMY